jgi:hypothetical protein
VRINRHAKTVTKRPGTGKMDDIYDTLSAGEWPISSNEFNDNLIPYAAVKKLEAITSERAKGEDASYQLARFIDVSNTLQTGNRNKTITRTNQNIHLQQNSRVIKYEYPTTWRLIYEGNGTENAEEVVLRLQGAITQKDLPPITNKPKHVSLLAIANGRLTVHTGTLTRTFTCDNLFQSLGSVQRSSAKRSRVSPKYTLYSHVFSKTGLLNTGNHRRTRITSSLICPITTLHHVVKTQAPSHYRSIIWLTRMDYLLILQLET